MYSMKKLVYDNLFFCFFLMKIVKINCPTGLICNRFTTLLNNLFCRYRKDAEQLKFQIEREQDMFRKQYSEAETQLMTEKQQNRQFVIQLQAKQQENQRIHTEVYKVI